MQGRRTKYNNIEHFWYEAQMTGDFAISVFGLSEALAAVLAILVLISFALAVDWIHTNRVPGGREWGN